MKKALITGITGQDGYYLAKLLFDKGYQIYGTHRQKGEDVLDKFSEISGKLELINTDITQYSSAYDVIKSVKPDEIYNLAGISSVLTSNEHPEETELINSVALVENLSSQYHSLNLLLLSQESIPVYCPCVIIAYRHLVLALSPLAL